MATINKKNSFGPASIFPIHIRIRHEKKWWLSHVKSSSAFCPFPSSSFWAFRPVGLAKRSYTNPIAPWWKFEARKPSDARSSCWPNGFEGFLLVITCHYGFRGLMQKWMSTNIAYSNATLLKLFRNGSHWDFQPAPWCSCRTYWQQPIWWPSMYHASMFIASDVWHSIWLSILLLTETDITNSSGRCTAPILIFHPI